MNYQLLRSFLSVLTGVVIAIIIAVPIGLVAGLLVFSDSEVSASQSILSIVLLIIALIVSCVAGGYYCANMAKQKELIHAAITGVILTILYSVVNNFQFNLISFENGTIYYCFIPLTLAGAAIAIKGKNLPKDK